MSIKRYFLSVIFILTSTIPVMAGTGRARDGLLFFLAVLGLLCVILGIFYLVDLVRNLIRRFFQDNGQETLH